jgi:hypothetical protein
MDRFIRANQCMNIVLANLGPSLNPEDERYPYAIRDVYYYYLRACSDRITEAKAKHLDSIHEESSSDIDSSSESSEEKTSLYAVTPCLPPGMLVSSARLMAFSPVRTFMEEPERAEYRRRLAFLASLCDSVKI